MAKQVAVKAYSVGGNAFWRAGKQWTPNGAVHLLEPLELARLRQEPNIVVVATAESMDALAEAEKKAAANDARLLEQANARAKRQTERKLTVEYQKVEAVKGHIEEIKADMAEDGTTSTERDQLKVELNALEQKLRSMVEQQKTGK